MYMFKYLIYLILICNITFSFKLHFNNNFFSHIYPIKTKVHLKTYEKNIFDNELSMIGITQRNNSISNLEKISANMNKLPSLYYKILKNNIANEIIALGTCNRFELYAYSSNATNTLNKLENLLLGTRIDKNKNLKSELKLDKYKNIDVLKHIFSVSSGLDSLIFGEKQIECQIKKTIQELDKKKFYKLKNVFANSIKCSKEIRKIENFNKGDTSIVSVCVDLFIDKINNLTKILIVGSGDTSKTLINYFRNRKIFNLYLTGRNMTNTLKLKNNFNKLNITLVNYSSFTKTIYNYDYIFMATSSPIPIIKFDHLKLNNIKYNLSNNTYKITIIDLGVPKNVESKCKEINYICLFNIEDVKKIQTVNIQNNKIILNKCNNIIDLHISKFNHSIAQC